MFSRKIYNYEYFELRLFDVVGLQNNDVFALNALCNIFCAFSSAAHLIPLEKILARSQAINLMTGRFYAIGILST